MAGTFSHVFAERGSTRGIIDIVDPATGRSAICDESIDQIRARYPTAEIITWAAFQARQVAAQDAPIVWSATTADQYDEMLEVLPPALWLGYGFLVGEPSDHHAGTGRARFAAFLSVRGRYWSASRPLTIAEFRALDLSALDASPSAC